MEKRKDFLELVADIADPKVLYVLESTERRLPVLVEEN